MEQRDGTIPAGDNRHHSAAWSTGHQVQFYENDQFLVDLVGDYLADGVRVGQPIVVIATASHRQGFLQRLRQRGLDQIDIENLGGVMLDARETLSAFMHGGRPDPQLFEATVGNVMEKVVNRRPYVVVRAYGEMVDLLWREGKASAAIEVERLWNDLARRFSFSLLCAYDAASIGDGSGSPCVADICAAHTHVLPPESSDLGIRLGGFPS